MDEGHQIREAYARYASGELSFDQLIAISEAQIAVDLERGLLTPWEETLAQIRQDKEEARRYVPKPGSVRALLDDYCAGKLTFDQVIEANEAAIAADEAKRALSAE